MLSRILSVLRKSAPAGRPGDKVVELYDDRLWPWLRRFLSLWLRLAFYWGLTILLDAYGIGPTTHKYAYGLIRFWFFYFPVFGFFMQVFYSNYDELGVWTPGLSYLTAARSFLRDLFVR